MSTRPFIDEITIRVASGNGGRGSVSFLREKYRPRGGPDGGDGGKGGDLVFQVQPHLRTFAHLNNNKFYRAGQGGNGSGRKRHGKDGDNLVIPLPPGSLIYGEDESCIDLANSTSELCYLSGGRGGRGNAQFATSRRQAPTFAEPGKPGSEQHLRLELSLIADVGFVGYPNAGKSTLLSVLSNARPRIASYPFTTKTPNIGILRIYDQDIVLADIPGLIDGASTGRGLGFNFLRHINRTSIIAYLLDISENPVERFRSLQKELQIYNPSILERRQCLIASKMDISGSNANLKALVQELNLEVIPISSHSRIGLDYLTQRLFELLFVSIK